MFGYRVPAPDEAMLISGGKQKADEGGQFRIVTGHGAWVMPFFRKVRFLSLEVHTVDFSEKCYTNHGITVNVSAVVAFKVDNHPNAITAAAQRFLNDQKKGQMEELTRKIFVGHLRGIVGRMTVEEIIQNREKLTEEVLTGSQSEMSNMGLHVDSLQIETFDDADGSYITDMAKPQRAAIDQAAKVAQAKADQAAQAAQQESERAQAQQARDTEIARAQYKAEVDKAEQEAAQAGPLAQAAAQQAVIDAKSEVAQRNAELRQQELVAEVIKPAEAEKQRLRIVAEGQAQAAEQQAKTAEWTAAGQAKQTKLAAEAAAEAQRQTAAANAEATRVNGEAAAYAKTQDAQAEQALLAARAEGARLMADAMAANEGAQLKLKEIEIQPQIAAAIADGLNLGGANLTILNGAEGLTQMLASVVPLVKGVMESFRSPIEEYKGVPDSPATLAANGMPSTPATQK
jgi:uncharacterized membrane protein YqiK